MLVLLGRRSSLLVSPASAGLFLEALSSPPGNKCHVLQWVGRKHLSNINAAEISNAVRLIRSLGALLAATIYVPVKRVGYVV
jgi:hypothetical protein